MRKPLRILIVDDDHRMARTLMDILNVKGYQADAVFSGEEALRKVKAISYDCVLSDIKMPEIDGVELFREIKAEQPDLPVVLMTAYAGDKLVKEGLKEGAIASLTKPIDIDTMLSFFSSLRKEQVIVIVDDDPAFCKILGDILKTRNFTVIEIGDPWDLKEVIKDDGRIIVLLDMKLKGIDGLDVLQDIQEQQPNLPVILVTGYREKMAKSIKKALKISAYTCLYKPLQIEELIRILAEIHHTELGKILDRGSGK